MLSAPEEINVRGMIEELSTWFVGVWALILGIDTGNQDFFI
jgi:hypothetical protein